MQHLNPTFSRVILFGVHHLFPLAFLLGTGVLGNSAQAQIIPDNSLGSEASVVIPGSIPGTQGHRIDGGAIRSEILFHSFSDFNIGEQQGAYFSNPAGVTNILSRVTGANRSDILGTLGVLGNANLFLLNPNGIVFGPDSSLDIAGSFVATTADRFTFADGSEFRAINPNAAPLLNVAVPVGLQYGSGRSGAIINAGQLEVGIRQALTLTGETVVNTGSLTAQGGEVAIASLSGPADVQLGSHGQLREITSLTDLVGPARPEAPSVHEIVANIPVELGLVTTVDGQVMIASSGTLIPTASGDTMVSGVLNAAHSEPGQQGGAAIVLGDRVALVDTAHVTVNGDAGGGVVLMGGGLHGQGAISNAQHTYLGPNTFVSADALTSGDGGIAIAWADQNTHFYGTISTRGGSVTGDGGFVEVSGQQHLTVQGNVWVDAANGSTGTLLLDPENIIIANGRPPVNGDVQDNPQLNANVPAGDPVGQILAAQGTGTFTIFERKLENLAGTANIVLEATNDITLENLADDALTLKTVNPGTTAGTIQLTADADQDGAGAFSMDISDTIQTNGRDITISGASLTLGSIDTSPISTVQAIDLDPATLDNPNGLIPATGAIGSANFSFTVPNNTIIRDLDIRVAAEHTYLADLRAALTSPDGTTAVLFDGVGSSEDNFQDTVFDSDASEAIASGSAPFNGAFMPQEDLSVFETANAGGTWTLTIDDRADGDSGQILRAGDRFNSLPNAPLSDGTQLLLTTDTVAGDGGNINLTATTADLTVNGNLIASSTVGNSGNIQLNALGSITLNGELAAVGQTGATDGSIRISAGVSALPGPPTGNLGNANINLTGPQITTGGLVELSATNDITLDNLGGNQPGGDTFTFQGDASGIRLIADADQNGIGDFIMNAEDTIRTTGGNLEVSGAGLTIGTIDTSPSRQAVVEAINVDAGGAIPEGAPDNTSGTSTFTFTVPQSSETIQDLDVRFSAAHTYVGDLTATLANPTNTTAILFEGVGGSGDNFQDTVLDSDAPNSLSSNAAPFDGTFAPQEDLGVFDQTNPSGAWTLTVTDNADGDLGQLFQEKDQAPWGEALGTQLLITTEALEGDGGTLDLTATAGNLSVSGDLITASQGGNGGAVTLLAENGTITLNGNVITTGAGGVDAPELDGAVIITATGGETGSITFTGSDISTRSTLELRADHDINLENLAQGQGTATTLAFPAGSAEITITADADGNGQGGFMMDSADTIRTAGRDITISGADLTVGSIDTTRSDTVAIALNDFAAPNPNGLIPQTGSSGDATFSFTVPDNVGSIQDLDLQLAIEHTYVGDLTVQLTAPTSKDPQTPAPSVVLLERIGGDGDNLQDTVFDSEATLPIQDGSTPFSGTYQPQGNLTVFNDVVPEGDWTLTVTDAFEGDSGRIIRPGQTADWGTAAGTQLLISTDAATGDGGTIDLTSTNGDITVSDLLASSTAGMGGDINLTANGGNINLNGSQLFSNSVSGAAVTRSNQINLSANSRSTTNATLRGGMVNLNQSQLSVENSDDGLAGRISITANNDIMVTDSSLLANGNDGQIFIGAINATVAGDTPQQITITDSQISTSDIVDGVVRADRQAGIIELQAQEAIALTNSRLESRTTSNGSGGSIMLMAPDIEIIDNAVLTASTEGPGTGGSIQVQARDFTLGTDSRILTRALISSEGIGGVIDLNASNTLQITGGAYLDAGTSGQGDGGDIRVSTADPTTAIPNPNGVLTLNGGAITAGSELTGNGGNISIQVGRAALTNGASIEANSNGTGNAGRITIQTANTNPNQFALALDNSSISALLGGNSSGNGEAIAITTDSLQLRNGARIETETLGAGAAGDIILESDRTIDISGTNPDGFNSGISTASNGRTSGRAGAILINNANNPRGTLNLENNGFLSSGTFSKNAGGEIDIHVETITVSSGGQMLSSTFGSGAAGSIFINATGAVTIDGTGTAFDFDTVDDPFAGVILTALTFANTRNPEQKDLPTGRFANQTRPDSQQERFDYYSFSVSAANSQGIFDIDNGKTDNNAVESIDTELFLFNRQTGELLAGNDDSEQDPGSNGTFDASIDFIFTDPGDYVIGVGQFDSFASTGSLVEGNEVDRGQTYDLRVSLENQGVGDTNREVSPNPNEAIDGILRSAIAARTEDQGMAGNITINTPQLTVQNSAQITAGATAQGSAGTVTIEASESITLDDGLNRLPDQRGGGIIAEATNGGSAGAIALTTPQLTIDNGATVSTTIGGTNPDASAGSVIINARNIALTGNESGILASTTGEAIAGNLTIQPDQGESLTINFADGAEIAASTSGAGKGGDLILNGRDRIDLQGNGRVSAASTGMGDAGGLELNTDQLILANGVELSAATITSDGSPVELLDLDQPLDLINTRITASTVDGNAGSLIVRAPSIRLSGIFSDANGNPILDDEGNVQPAGLFAAATGLGDAGFITISTPGSFIVENGAQTTISTEAGTGGSLSIVANDIRIRNPQQETRTETGLLAQSDSGSSGNITLSQIQTLEIQDGGQLSTTTASGQAGAITVNVPTSTATAVGATEATTAIDSGSPATSIIVQGIGSVLSAQAGEDGRAGNVTLNTTELQVTEGGQITASNINSDRGGSITIQQLNQLSLTNGGQITAETERGNAGNVIINAEGGTIQLLGPNALLSARANATGGKAGNLEVLAQSLSVQNQAEVSASNVNSLEGGNVTLTGLEQLQVRQGGRITATTQTGAAGSVEINVEGQPVDSIVVQGESSQVSAQANFVGGDAGQVHLNVRRLEVSNGAQITASNVSGQNGNSTVRLENLETLQVIGEGSISARTNQGQAGDVLINVDDDPVETLVVNGDRSRITAEATQNQGEAGSVRINAAQVQVSNRASINASNQNGTSGGSVRLQNVDHLSVRSGGQIVARTTTGLAGSVRINSGPNTSPVTTMTLSGGSQISARADGPNGVAGNVNINAQQVSVVSGAEITASNLSSAGSLQTVGSVRLNTVDRLRLRSGGRISAETESGQAGNVIINAEGGSIQLSGDRTLLTAQATGSGGTAGDVTLTAQSLTVRNQSVLSASSVDSLNGGSVTLHDIEQLNVIRGGRITAETTTGAAGSVTVNSDSPPVESVMVRGAGSQISARASQGRGNAGQVQLNAQHIQVSNGARITASNVAGQAGNSTVRLDNVETLQVASGGQISARTKRGNAGDVLINRDSNPAESLTVTGDRSRITAQAGDNGDAGEVVIHARHLRVQDQGQITVQTEAGNGGDIRLFGLEHAHIRDQGQITAATQSGQAGDIDIEARAVTVTNGGVIEVQGNAPSNSNAIPTNGSIRSELNRNQNTPGGLAGNLNITANSLLLDQGFLRATTGRNDGPQTGGNITIHLGQGDFIENLEVNGLTHIQNSLLLRDGEETTHPTQNGVFSGALIEANAVGSGVNAGKITITTGDAARIRQGGNVSAGDGFIIAIMPQSDRGSDITTNAESARGGVITINTLGLLGIQVRDRLTTASDITSISEVDGSTGSITINDLGIDPSRGLIALPIDLITSPPVNASCSAETAASHPDEQKQNEFVIIGRGGLPQHPAAPISNHGVTTPWVSRNIAQPATASLAHTSNSLNNHPTAPIDVQGWITDPQGNIILTAHPQTNDLPQFLGQTTSGVCQP